MSETEMLKALLDVESGLKSVGDALEEYQWEELAAESRRLAVMVMKLFDSVRATAE